MATLFPMLFSLLLVMLSKNVESQNTSFNIHAFTPHSVLLTYERDAFVPPDNTYVRLVPADETERESVGRVLYSKSITFWEQGKQASFDTTITLQITPVRNPFNGMTFFIVPVNSTLFTGGDGGNLGIYDALVTGSPFFAVEFDPVTNPEYDPNFPHMGININSKRSQNYTKLDGATRKLVTARITYDAPTRKINVVATYGSSTKTVSYVFNLKALLPEEVQVGLSASTGTLGKVSDFDAFTWYFNSTMVADVNSVVEDDTYIKKYVM